MHLGQIFVRMIFLYKLSKILFVFKSKIALMEVYISERADCNIIFCKQTLFLSI